jgi:hypothetical protein
MEGTHIVAFRTFPSDSAEASLGRPRFPSDTIARKLRQGCGYDVNKLLGTEVHFIEWVRECWWREDQNPSLRLGEQAASLRRRERRAVGEASHQPLRR